MFARYEHLGDTVLGLTITSLLIEMFPGLRVGPSTVSRRVPQHFRTFPNITSPENPSYDSWKSNISRDVSKRGLFVSTGSNNIELDR